MYIINTVYNDIYYVPSCLKQFIPTDHSTEAWVRWHNMYIMLNPFQWMFSSVVFYMCATSPLRLQHPLDHWQCDSIINESVALSFSPPPLPPPPELEKQIRRIDNRGIINNTRCLHLTRSTRWLLSIAAGHGSLPLNSSYHRVFILIWLQLSLFLHDVVSPLFKLHTQPVQWKLASC